MRFDAPVFLHPSGGRCYASRSVATLHAEAARRGATLHFEEPVRDIHVDDEVAVVRTDVEEYRAGAVVVAAGAWVAKLVGGRLPLPPLAVTREQPVHFRPLDPAHRWPSFIEHARDASFTTYGLLSPGEGVKLGEHMVGPAVDADEVDRTADPEATARVVAHARRYLPGVDPVPTIVETCLYTTTTNEDFVIDRRGPLTVASPCSGHGFKFGPATGELVARVAVGEVSAPPRFRL
jgi:sarcosine oxidase